MLARRIASARSRYSCDTRTCCCCSPLGIKISVDVEGGAVQGTNIERGLDYLGYRYVRVRRRCSRAYESSRTGFTQYARGSLEGEAFGSRGTSSRRGRQAGRRDCAEVTKREFLQRHRLKTSRCGWSRRTVRSGYFRRYRSRPVVGMMRPLGAAGQDLLGRFRRSGKQRAGTRAQVASTLRTTTMNCSDAENTVMARAAGPDRF